MIKYYNRCITRLTTENTHPISVVFTRRSFNVRTPEVFMITRLPLSVREKFYTAVQNIKNDNNNNNSNCDSKYNQSYNTLCPKYFARYLIIFFDLCGHLYC